MTDIERQQKAAADILKIANENGLVCIIWTLEDAEEALCQQLNNNNMALEKDEILNLAGELLDKYESQIEQQSIELGWHIMRIGAEDIVDGLLEISNINKNKMTQEANTLRSIRFWTNNGS